MPTMAAFSKKSFFEDLGYRPHKGQREVHNSTASRRVCACGVRWGKTLCAAMEGLAAAMEPKEQSIGWVVGPTYDLASKVFRELISIAGSKLRHRLVSLKENDRAIVLRNLAGGRSEIRAKSADNPVSLLGEGLDWVIVDEGARLRPMIWESHITQRLIDKKGWALLISTPRGKGWFYDLFRRGQRDDDPDYASWNLPSWSNPHLDSALIEEERNRLPERVFRQEFGGEFIEGSGQVFRYVREAARGRWQDPKENELYYAGLDLAKVEDYTVLVVLNEKREVVFTDRFHRIDWSMQIARVQEALDRYNSAPVLIDSTGAGEPVFEALCHAGVCAEGYPFTARSKADLVNALQILFEKRLITLPRPDLWDVGVDELESFEYSVTDSGNVRMSAPPGIHDDCVIALGLAAWWLRWEEEPDDEQDGRELLRVFGHEPAPEPVFPDCPDVRLVASPWPTYPN